MKNGFLSWLLKKHISDEKILDQSIGAVAYLVQKGDCIRVERGNSLFEKLIFGRTYNWQQPTYLEKILPLSSYSVIQEVLKKAAADSGRDFTQNIHFKSFRDDLLNCKMHILCLSASSEEARYIMRLEYDRHSMIKAILFKDALRQSRVNCWYWDIYTGMANFYNTDTLADSLEEDIMSKEFFVIKNFPHGFVKMLHFVGDYSDSFIEFIRNLLAQKIQKDVSTEIAFKTKSGKLVWIVFTARIVRDESGTLQYVVGTWQNITDKKLDERQQQHNNRLMDSFVKETLYGLTVDLNKNFFVADSSLECWMEDNRVFAAYYDQAVKEMAEKSVVKEDRQKFLEFFDLKRVRDLPENTNCSLEYRRDYKEQEKWLKATLVTFRLDEDAFSDKWMYVSIYDIDAGKQRESKLEQLAATDALTGLFNRAYMLQEMQDYLKKNPAESVAVVYMDLDNFKKVNDTLGHAAGDGLLICMADAMRSYFGKKAMLGRIGGDEFIMMDLAVDKGDIAKQMSDFVNYAGESCRKQCPSVNVTVSLGYVLSPEFGRDVAVLADLADKALYSAKRHGKNNAVQYVK